jgi:subtilase family serine protease
VPGQPGYPYNQPPTPPAKNSMFLMMTLGGLALLVILVPLLLFALSRNGSPTTPITQATATSVPTATPTPTSDWVFTPAGTAPTSAQCMNVIDVPCYSPEEMQEAFSLNALYKQGLDGKGQTIVIIGAGNTQNIQSDLQAFDKAWGLPDPPSFKIIKPYGDPTSYTCNDGGPGFDGLQVETALDVEWSHAMAPGASIVMVVGSNKERTYFPVPKNAPTCGFYDLEQPVNYALDNHLGNIISISYGGSELGADTDTSVDKANEKKEYDTAHAIFQKAASMGVTVMSSAGDSGATNNNDYVNQRSFWNKPNVSWPASDPYVLAIGGTSLTIQDANGTYGSETAWNNGGATGGGLSVLYGEPSYQKKVQDQSIFQGKRGMPDVAFPADVNYLLYEQSDYGPIDASKWAHWNLIGGTSASSPCWAGLIAIADQISVQSGGKPLGFIQPGLYSLQGQNFHDVTRGDNSFQHVAGYQALTGFDLVTGWGTPIADQLLPALVQAVQKVGNSP